MPGSERTRVSIVAFNVEPDRRVRFLELMDALHAIARRKGYGTHDLLVDPRTPLAYFNLQAWATDEAVRHYQDDPDVRVLVDALGETATLRPIVEAATSVGRSAPDEGDLLAAARGARDRAHARFSGFKVGAALETADGAIVTGCNVENATYGLTLCAERVAVFRAIAEGHRSFRRVAVVADTDTLTPPCGACRQILWEFGGDLGLVLGNLDGKTLRLTMKDLLPLPFDASFLDR